MYILSVVVPSYNSEDYLANCIDTLLGSGDGIEIIIVNDGSVDGTRKIADNYAKTYSNVKAIHQDNAGHGGAVNTGIANANGKYFKVVDSDDWVNSEKLKKVVNKLASFIDDNEEVDMVLANFVYDKVNSIKKKIMNYTGVIPKDKIVTWDDVGKFKTSKYILMHSVFYSMDILKKSKIVLPKHTFYVDNLYVYIPLQFVNTMYYIDECVYHYFIGRDEQSVNEKVMMKRIDQQLFVNITMINSVDFKTIEPRSKQLYMMHYLNVISTVSSVLLIKIGTKEAFAKKNNLWNILKDYDLKLYYRMRNSVLGMATNIPGSIGRNIAIYAYKKAQKRVGFN